MFRFWRKYFGEPAIFAPEYTRRSRNYLNLGIGALVVSLYFFTFPSAIRFAFTDFSAAEIQKLERVSGEWLYIGGRDSMHLGIVAPGTEKYLAYLGVSVPARIGPQSAHRPASGRVVPGVGIVQLEVDGGTVLSIAESQAYFRQRIFLFLGLIAISAFMFLQSFLRQLDLLNHDGERIDSPSSVDSNLA